MKHFVVNSIKTACVVGFISKALMFLSDGSRQQPGHPNGSRAEPHGRDDRPMCGEQPGGDRIPGDAEGKRTRRPDGAGHDAR